MMSFSLSSLLWLVLVVVFALLEAATVGLVCIWFAAGAVVALLVSAFTTSFAVQIGVFLLVSLAALALTRPLVKKMKLDRHEPTNADRNLGRKCTVIASITPDFAGRVKLDGVDWAARAQETLPEGTVCVVTAVDGATLTVRAETAPVAVMAGAAQTD